MSRQIQAGTIDVSIVLRIIDSTDGTPETGVVFDTAGLDLQYRRELAASVAITEATLAALTTAHTDGGFLHIGNGYYRLDLPDAACAGGAVGVLIHGTVTGMVVIGEYIELVAYNPYDAVALGLSNLDATVSSRATQTSVDTIATAVDTEVAAIKAKTDQLIFTTANKVDSTIQAAGDFAQAAADKVWASTTRELTAFSTALALSVWHVLEAAIVTASTIGLKVKTNLDATISSRSTYAGADTAGTTTLLSRIIGILATGTHQPQSGDSYARLGTPAGASVSADLAAIEAQTDDIGAAGAGLTAIPSIVTVTGNVNGSVASIGAGGIDNAAFAVTEVLNANVQQWNGQAVATPSVAGVPEVDVTHLEGDTTALANLRRSAVAIYRGSVTATSTTTAIVDSSLTQSATNFWKGRIVLFTSGSLQYQVTEILGFDPATDTLTVTALTAAPSVADQYVVL